MLTLPFEQRAALHPEIRKWHPASGHPKGWRVVRETVYGIKELESKRGNRILFKSFESANRRAVQLNSQAIPNPSQMVFLVGHDYEGEPRHLGWMTLERARETAEQCMKEDEHGPAWLAWEIWGNRPCGKYECLETNEGEQFPA